MKRKYILLLIILMALGVRNADGQNPTVSIDDYEEIVGPVSIPIEVADFSDPIAAITLYIEYDESVLTFNSHSNGLVSGILSNSYPSTNGYTVAISWFNENGVDVSAGGVLMTLNFIYLGSTSTLDFVSGCEIAGVNSQIIYPQYEGGSISPDPASVPIDIVDQLNLDPANLPGYIDVPIDVDFDGATAGSSTTGVGSFNFEIEYDPAILTFQSLSFIDASISEISVNTVPGPPRVVMAWNVNPENPDPTEVNGILVTMRFTYTGGNTELEFLTAACAIADFDANPLTALYSDGIITQNPNTMANVIIDDVVAPVGVVEVPVRVLNFDDYVPDFGAFDYSIGFNSSVLQFITLSYINPKLTDPQPSQIQFYAIPDELNVSWNAVGPGVSFDDDEVLFTMQFQYLGTNQDLVFKEAQCSMSDWDANPIIGYYDDGSVTELPSDLTVCMEEVVGTLGAPVTMPVKVTDFKNVGAITLEFLFNTSQLNYIGIQSENSILTNNGLSNYSSVGGVFAYSWTIETDPPPPGFENGITIPEGEALFEIVFQFISGPAPITFNIPSCEIADFDANAIPVTYCDGLVKSVVDVEIKAFLQGLYNTGTSQMNKAQEWNGSAFEDKYPGTVADLITIELHDKDNYATIVETITNVELDQDGTASFQLPATYTGEYYITLKNRNHLETVSKNSISFAGGSVFWDFTIAKDQAYGPFPLNPGNQIELKTDVWGIFGGDANKDGFIDGLDVTNVIFRLRQGAVGYRDEDINGNGTVDGPDLTIVILNSRNGIEKITPP